MYSKPGLSQLAHITMTVRKVRNTWWVDFSDNTVRYRKKSPENSKTGAEAYEAVLRQKLARGEPLTPSQPDRKQKEREQKFRDFAWEWFNTYVKSNNKHSEMKHKMYALRTHLIPFFGNTPLNKIETLQIEQYKSRKIGAGLMNKTINNHLTVLSSCLHIAQDWFELQKIPKIKKLKVPPQKFNFLTFEESEQLLAHSYGVWHDIILLALKTGLRMGELRALHWSDVGYRNKDITVRHSWNDRKKVLEAPKSNKERRIPLTNELYETLMERKQSSGFIFTNEKGEPFNDKRLNEELSKICRSAGVKEITCHALRHTYASHLTMRGAPLKAIQELMGHANIQTTMRYVHLSPSSLREAVSLLEDEKEKFSNYGLYTVNTIPQPANVSSVFKTQNPELALFKATNEH